MDKKWNHGNYIESDGTIRDKRGNRIGEIDKDD